MKTIIIGENHEDPAARLFVRLNIDLLMDKGFSFFGFEHGEKTGLAKEIQWLQENLDTVNCCTGLMAYVFFNSEYHRMQSNRQLLALFKTISRKNIEYHGLDVDIGNRWSSEVTVQSMLNQLAELAESNDFDKIIQYRDEIIVNNLLKHREKRSFAIQSRH